MISNYPDKYATRQIQVEPNPLLEDAEMLEHHRIVQTLSNNSNSIELFEFDRTTRTPSNCFQSIITTYYFFYELHSPLSLFFPPSLLSIIAWFGLNSSMKSISPIWYERFDRVRTVRLRSILFKRAESSIRASLLHFKHTIKTTIF